MNRRDRIGIAAWVAVSILVGMLPAWVMMAAREFWQHVTYDIPVEDDDIDRYSIAILLGGCVHWAIIYYILR